MSDIYLKAGLSSLKGGTERGWKHISVILGHIPAPPLYSYWA